MIPAVDVRRRALRLYPAFRSASTRVIEGERLVLGPELETLEEELALWSGYRHAVGVASGSAALHLTLRAVGVSLGDEVLVPAFGPPALAGAVVTLGAVPVFVDVDPVTAAIDPATAVAACTPRTRAAIVHHTFGRPAQVPDLAVPVVEDATHAAGAIRHHDGGSPIVYSCHPSAPLGGMGDGGVIMSDDDVVAQRLRRLRDGGQDVGPGGASVYVEPSLDFRPSEMAAAWLRISLRVLGPDTARRRAIVQRYRKVAAHLPWQADHTEHAYHLAVLRVPDRVGWRDRMAEAGVGTAVHWPLALTSQPAYRALVTRACPVAEVWAAEALTVPAYPDLTDDEVRTVAAALMGAGAS